MSGPVTLALDRELPPVLGFGALLKSTVCAARGRTAWISGDLGALDTAEAAEAFTAAVDAMRERLGTDPVAIAHDRHPDFFSTRHAQRCARAWGCEAVAVQHHHAHTAAVCGEHGHDGPVLGLSLDGFGLGDDRASWGGELLVVDARGFRRWGHLRELPQPGGDAAAHQPWRMAAAALHVLGRGDEIATRFAAQPGAAVVARMLERGVHAPPTSSAGRLFDAACGLLGVRPVAEFEGQAPMELERMVTTPRIVDGGWSLDGGVLDLRGLLADLVDRDPADGADRFHGTLVAALVEWVARASADSGVRVAALSGGCLLNRVLRAGLVDGLEAHGIRPLLPVELGPGDPALSFGQAWAVGRARK